MSSYVSVGILSAILVFPAGMLLTAIFRSVESVSTYKMRQRRRVQRVQESIAIKTAMDLTIQQNAGATSHESNKTPKQNKPSPKPSPPPPEPASGGASYKRRAAGRSPASHAPQQSSRSSASGAGSCLKLARVSVRYSLAAKLKADTKLSAAFAPLRMRAAMQPAASALAPTTVSRSQSVSARPPEPRSGQPSRPRSLRPSSSRQSPVRPPPPRPNTAGGTRGVRDYLPRRLFGIRGDIVPPPPPAPSLRDKSVRRKSRRESGLTLQTDRLLPIAEMDENGLSSPTGTPHASRTMPPFGVSDSRLQPQVSPSSSSAKKAKKRGDQEVCIDPTLAPVAYLALVAWVGLCLYLIILHGLALSESSQRFWAWVVAGFVALTHELLIQQVLALFLKLLVARRSLPPLKSTRKATARGSAATSVASSEVDETHKIVPFKPKTPTEKGTRPRRPPPVRI